MKKIALAFLLLASPACAADAVAPTCGKTIQECQVKVDAQAAQIADLTAQFAAMHAAAQLAVAQRNSVADAAVNSTYDDNYKRLKPVK